MAKVVRGLGGPEGLGEITLPRSDDGAFLQDISAVFGQGPTLFGKTLAPDAFHIGTNGVVSFGKPVTGYPPEADFADAPAIIAPFWADADVRLIGEGRESGAVHVDLDATAGIVTVTWHEVGRFRRDMSAPNTFQLQLVDRGGGDLDIVFRYEEIGWTSGDKSSGAPALIGLAAGNTTVELPASNDADAQRALPAGSGNAGAGHWKIAIRDGTVADGIGLVQTQTGTAAADDLTGGPGSDRLYGGAGNDTLAGGGGADTLDGGPGTDTAVFGFDLADARFFRDGDELRVTRPGTADIAVLRDIEVLRFADRTIDSADVPLSGTSGPDLIEGGPGDDALFGGGGDDTLVGGGGNDTLDGGAGTNTAVFGFAHADATLLWEGSTLQVIAAGAVARLKNIATLHFTDRTVTTLPLSLSGTAGADEISGGAGDDTISGGAGNDTLRGGAGNDLLFGGSGDDWLIGGTGDDTLVGGGGSNRLEGGPGDDTARFPFTRADAQIVVEANGRILVSKAGSSDIATLIDIETIAFSDQSVSTLVAVGSGGSTGQTLTGGPGDDTLIGGPGDDVIFGGPGNDLLRGEGGDDTIHGGDGRDTIHGGPGNDVIYGGTSVNDLSDLIFAGDGDDLVFGGHGNDIIHGMGGNDTLSGGFGADELYGGPGDDVINGGPLSDLIFGGPGDDFLNGGFGHDRLNGGPGADTFFHLGIPDHGSDWIQDYSAAEGDVLLFGQAGASFGQFQINTAFTPDAGASGVAEVFVIHKPTGQIVWALVDGMANAAIHLQIVGSDAVFDLLA